MDKEEIGYYMKHEYPKEMQYVKELRKSRNSWMLKAHDVDVLLSKSRAYTRRWATCAACCGALALAAIGIGVGHANGLQDKLEAAEARADAMPEVQIVEVEPMPIYYDVPLTNFQQDTLRVIADHYGMDVRIPLAVMQQETGFRSVIGDDGESAGIMQIQQKWHKARMERLGVTELDSFFSNALVGCDFLAELLAKYPLANALAYYNSGKADLPNEYAESVLAIMEGLEVRN